MKRALISVSDKENILEFAKGLIQYGFEIISTGGTYQYLMDNGIHCIAIDAVTGFPEILEGRVKTLHPAVHGGILAKRDSALHQEQLQSQQINHIDLVCVNLYPFKETLKKPNVSDQEIIENIDIGGPSMLRSAAKNFKDVIVVCDKNDYDLILSELSTGLSLERREFLAAKVFSTTAAYDSAIANYFASRHEQALPYKTLSYQLADHLRYGENPHQQAAHYVEENDSEFALQNAVQLHGKKMSYNNLQDASAALDLLAEFDDITCVALKHNNPCGVASGKTVLEAFEKAYDADPISIFGGIVAVNGKVDIQTAELMNKIFLEIIIAYEFDEEALELLKTKKNLRLFTIPKRSGTVSSLIKSVRGGVLIQDYDSTLVDELKFVSETTLNEAEIEDALFAMKVVKHVKSNAIVIAKNKQTLGIGAGQMNRVGSVKIALDQAKEKAVGALLASDAFFPMNDSVQLAAKAKIKGIIQPGGSIKDQDSIDVCNKEKVAMIFSGLRHFKH